MERIIGQVIYTGPTIPQVGLQTGCIFQNGIHEHLYNVIAECASLGELFVPVGQYAAVRRELNFDIARNMRGTVGRYPQLYRAVQKWLIDRAQKTDTKTPKPKGVKVKQHA